MEIGAGSGFILFGGRLVAVLGNEGGEIFRGRGTPDQSAIETGEGLLIKGRSSKEGQSPTAQPFRTEPDGIGAAAGGLQTSFADPPAATF